MGRPIRTLKKSASAAMAVGRGFLRSHNLVNILYIYLILGGITVKNNTRKHTEGKSGNHFYLQRTRKSETTVQRKFT